MTNKKLSPISLRISILIFGGGCLLFILLQRIVIPELAAMGVHPALNFLLLISPHMIFFFGALAAYRKEGNPWTLEALFSRFRIKPIKNMMWLWTLLFAAVNIGLYLLMYQGGYLIVKWLYQLIPPPAVLDEIMGDANNFAGFTLKGNWWLLGLFFFMFFFNVLGEEFLWRGLLFPRQELTHGKSTWIVHGLLWTGFHLFEPYNAFMVLPGALFMSFIVQKFKNTSIFIVAHALLNSLAMIRIFQGIIG